MLQIYAQYLQNYAADSITMKTELQQKINGPMYDKIFIENTIMTDINHRQPMNKRLAVYHRYRRCRYQSNVRARL